MAVSSMLSLSVDTIKLDSMRLFSSFRRFSVSRQFYSAPTRGSMRKHRMHVLASGRKELEEEDEVPAPDFRSSKGLLMQKGYGLEIGAHLDPCALDARRANQALLFMIVFPALGVPMFDSSAIAAEVTTQEFRSASFPIEWVPLFTPFLGDLDPGTAGLITTFVRPLITILNLLFIFRIVMSWYPGIPVQKFPFSLVYNPTEPVLGPTRRLIPPVGGVDVSPVIWVALVSFINEILLGKQGLLVLLSQRPLT